MVHCPLGVIYANRIKAQEENVIYAILQKKY